MSSIDLKKDLKEKKPIIGSDRTLKALKNGKLERIYMASNTKEDIKEDIKYYSKLANVKVIELKEDNSKLGIICKKPFNISVISF